MWLSVLEDVQTRLIAEMALRFRFLSEKAVQVIKERGTALNIADSLQTCELLPPKPQNRAMETC
jgi:hypothetical protein